MDKNKVSLAKMGTNKINLAEMDTNRVDSLRCIQKELPR